MYRAIGLAFIAFSLHAGQMAGMDMGDQNPAETFLMNLASGTAVNPESSPMPMDVKPVGTWNAMFMAQAFINETQQSGPRGGDKFYSANWFMAGAEHSAGEHGAFQVSLMLSLDPATITGRRYPLLFQTGETAFGKPLVDAQHPHDLIMSMGFQYAHSLGENATLELYFAPVGDPALGPVAFPHRSSAMELPQATISHHLQDSTHIANEVVTAGVAYKRLRLETSGFYGSEPNENRWNIDSGPINSWSARLWVLPAKNWAAQVSVGRIAKPEEKESGDQVRSTASLHYSKPFGARSWSSSVVWGRNHGTQTKRNTNSYLAETVLPAGRNNFVTGRIELVDKDELFTTGAVYRIGAYTIGYTRDVDLFSFLETGIGFNLESYSLPDAIKPEYGSHPVSGNVFLRVRLKRQT